MLVTFFVTMVKQVRQLAVEESPTKVAQYLAISDAELRVAAVPGSRLNPRPVDTFGA
jgi:hypothetical protein